LIRFSKALFSHYMKPCSRVSWRVSLNVIPWEIQTENQLENLSDSHFFSHTRPILVYSQSKQPKRKSDQCKIKVKQTKKAVESNTVLNIRQRGFQQATNKQKVDVPLVVSLLRWFFCLLGGGSFHFVLCILPILGALVYLWLAGFHLVCPLWEQMRAYLYTGGASTQMLVQSRVLNPAVCKYSCISFFTVCP
jgi:hypothetical protein